METRIPKRKKVLSIRSNEDRISELPDHIIHNIQRLLPIKSAARTSILSRRWRSVFFSIPVLDFTTINPGRLITPEDAYVMDYEQDENREMLDFWNRLDLDFINNLLSMWDNYPSSITTMKLKGNLSLETLHKIIKYAAKHYTRELVMHVKTRDRFNLPGSITNCESLRILDLRSEHPGFTITPSQMKGRFIHLHTMALSRIVFLGHDESTFVDLFTDFSFPCLKKLLLDSCENLTKLNVACSSLEDLSITRCYQLITLDIVGKNLERLKVSLCFDRNNIVTSIYDYRIITTPAINSKVRISAPAIKYVEWVYNILTHFTILDNGGALLEEAILNFSSIGFFHVIRDQHARSLSDMIKAFSHAKSLTFQPHCIKMLSRDDMQNILAEQEFESLRKLEIQTEFDEHGVHNNLPAIVILLKKSLNVHTLVFRRMNVAHIKKSKDDEYLEGQDMEMSLPLNHLTTVKFIGFLENVAMDICLVKFLMKNGRALENLILCLGPIENGRKFYRKGKIMRWMMGFSWASSEVKIVFQ